MKLLNKELLKKNLTKRISSDMAAGIISGSAALVRQNGEIICEEYFGSSVPGGSIPVNERTIFRLASMTKPITAAAALILVSRGQLRLDDPVEKYLPAFGQMHLAALDENGNLIDAGPVTEKITVLHLLTHTSGIGTAEVGDKQMASMTAKDNCTLENSVDYYSRQGLAFLPFSAQAYSPLAAFDVLARIIELITGEDYNTFLKRELFIPCDMPDTTFLPSTDQWSRIITMHNLVDGCSCVGETTENCTFFDVPCSHYLGGAGLISTARDYSNFAEMLLNRGYFKNHRILPGELIDLMGTPHVPESIMPGPERWGLSVRVITSKDYGDHGILPVGTFGWSGAYGTHFWVDPVNRITAVYMKNSLYDGGSEAVTSRHFEEDVNASLT